MDGSMATSNYLVTHINIFFVCLTEESNISIYALE